MDKELLRIAIIATGLIIMVAMIVSAYLKNKEAEEDEYEEYEDEFEDEYEDDDFEEEPVKKPSLAQSLKNAYQQKVQQVQQQRQKIVPVMEDDEEDESAMDLEPAHQKQARDDEEHHQQKSPTPSSILQFSVITKGEDDFNVADVFHVFESLGLEYGNMKVFERIDENRIVHFCVANMAEPGTFPDHDLESQYCPGVIFFMQFDDELQNPRETFDDYVSTAMLFADAMDGVVLDHRRQPLTDAMVNAIRAAI